MARRTWLDDQVDALLGELSNFELNVPRSAAAELLRDRVSALMQDLRVSERTARGYITAEVIRELARTLAFSVADEHPGADLFALPRDARLPWSGLGRLFAALAEAGRIRLVNGDPDGVADAFHLISAYGLLANDARWRDAASGADGVACPSAVLTRAARFLDTTVDMLRGGARLPGEADSATAEAVAGQMSYDAATLRARVTGGNRRS